MPRLAPEEAAAAKPADRTAQFERALAQAAVHKVELRLFIAGMGPRSTRAVEDLRRLSRELLGETCSIEIVDVYERPEAAAAAQVVAVPTLVHVGAGAVRRLIGTIGPLERLARFLGVPPRMPGD